MFAAGDSWRTVDLSDAAQAAWIHRGNAVLRNGKTCAVMLESQDVYLLTQAFHEHACPDAADLLNYTNYTDHAYPCQGWPLTVGSLDWFAREVASSVTDYAAAGRQGPTRAFFATNTDDCAARAAYTGSPWPSLCDGTPRLLYREFGTVVW